MNIIKIPFDAGSLGKNKGCALAPDEILKDFPDYSSENGRKRQLRIISVGADNSNFNLTQKEIEKSVSQVEEAIILGGDHSITYPSFKASKCDAIVVLDAHPDAMSGTEIPTHEDFARKLVEEGLSPKNIFLFGTRSWHSSEMEFLKEKGIKFFDMKQIFEFGIKNLCDTLMENVKDFKKLYLSIDIDVLDPAFAPGTGYCEPGGLSSRELIYLVQRLKNLKNLKFIDIVEANPKMDEKGKTINMCKKIILELF